MSVKKLDNELELYVQNLIQFHNIQLALAHQIELSTTLKPTNRFDVNFKPTTSSIQKQIACWPQDAMLLPVVLWVEPQEGVVKLNGEEWNYFIHGSQEITVTRRATSQEVMVIYTSEGNIGFNQWSMHLYLKGLLEKAPHLQSLVSNNEDKFNRLQELGHIAQVPPRLLFMEDVFRFTETHKSGGLNEL